MREGACTIWNSEPADRFVGRSGGLVASYCRLGLCGVSTRVRREGCRSINFSTMQSTSEGWVLVQSSTRCIFIARVPVVSMSD